MEGAKGYAFCQGILLSLDIFSTLLKYRDDPDEMTPQPISGATTSPPITSCHVASSASWDSKSERTLDKRGEDGWQSGPENPSSHL